MPELTTTKGLTDLEIVNCPTLRLELLTCLINVEFLFLNLIFDILVYINLLLGKFRLHCFFILLHLRLVSKWLLFLLL